MAPEKKASKASKAEADGGGAAAAAAPAAEGEYEDAKLNPLKTLRLSWPKGFSAEKKKEEVADGTARCALCAADDTAPGVVRVEQTLDGAPPAALWCHECAARCLVGECNMIYNAKDSPHRDFGVQCMPTDLNTWTIVARHAAGNMGKVPGLKLPNRMIVLRLNSRTAPAKEPAENFGDFDPDKEPFLVVINPLTPTPTGEPFTALKRLEQETGALVRFVMCPSSGHHLSVPAWGEHYEKQAQVIMPGGRIRRVRQVEGLPLDKCKGNIVEWDTGYVAGEARPADDAPVAASVSAVELPVLAKYGLHVWTLSGILEMKQVMKPLKDEPRNTEESTGIVFDESKTYYNTTHGLWFDPKNGSDRIGGLMRRMAGIKSGVGANRFKPTPKEIGPSGKFPQVAEPKVLATKLGKILEHDFERYSDLHIGANACVAYTDAKTLMREQFEWVLDPEQHDKFGKDWWYESLTAATPPKKKGGMSWWQGCQSSDGVSEPKALGDKNDDIIFVLGGPGTGKGTVCVKLAKEFGMPHLSMGDLLRAEIKSASDLGKEISSFVEEGKIVPVAITVRLLRAAIEKARKEYGADGVNGVLVDGFPRAMEQVEAWKEQMGGFGFVLYLNVKDEEVLVQRILKRAASGESDRPDDNEPTIRKRLEVNRQQCEPCIDHYRKTAPKQVKEIMADAPPDDVYAECRGLILTHFKVADAAAAGEEKKAKSRASKSEATPLKK